ncbi:MAG: type 2 isopentenyl-diphosphate Delta-isomerase [Chloroflexi bacterium]|nr:MAG: type 2 isopentenyl-diphosphate Delta-isomerase [Anaerolineaceae bacterium 4572_32.2]RLC77057.1 MAG: type 2 isopentenyl-diphosphate Delta-isomerase [Chloroflexota bacterium]RLC80766.1 MAG: type 2 isopentenyl-diphosphate Delta-isomerase [Chloroflexota bacterium]HEY74120.1 type 2 isopentenyl-diphosphate Delta-isomerase [Thermoflexia bacterium]
MSSQHQQRKSDHIRINLQEDIGFKHVSTGFERYRFTHCAMPGLDLEDVDTSVTLLGKRLAAPLLISSMTGGTPEAGVINQRLAEAAQAASIGMGLGSQRAAIQNPTLADTYRVRRVAPDILLLANLGAVQLNYGYGPNECRRAVEMVEADALILHLNPLQEALQPEGDTCFAGLLAKIGAVCQALEVPVVVKEVGWGISERVARQLANVGVAAIEVAGAGGSSWSQVEMHRATDELQRQVAAAFADWGIPTAESLLMALRGAPELLAIASGGIRDGIQVAKAIALGATACGAAGPFLHAASKSIAAVTDLIAVLVTQLRVAMFATGVADIPALQHTPLVSAAP